MWVCVEGCAEATRMSDEVEEEDRLDIDRAGSGPVRSPSARRLLTPR